MRHFIFLLFVFFFLGSAQARRLDKQACLSLKETDKTYFSSSDRVFKLNSVSAWAHAVNAQNKTVAFGGTDKTEFRKKRCFWQVTLYDSDETMLHLWRQYLVEINGKKLFYLDAADNGPIQVNGKDD